MRDEEDGLRHVDITEYLQQRYGKEILKKKIQEGNDEETDKERSV